MKFDLDALVRPNVKNLKPYSSARKEFAGAAEIFLDANENSFGSPALQPNFNRYPDPLQSRIKQKLSEWLDLTTDQIFVGNGSDEAIDLLLRVFCEPGTDEIIITPPTYGMYEVSANINNAQIKRVLLTENFALDADRVLANVADNTKLIFLCSPNNPSGNSLARESILKIAEYFAGIVVVDEAYIDFSSQKSFVAEIKKYPNLAVLQTFSKAWGLAGLRVGLALANAEIIAYLNKIKPPYNISDIAQETLLNALENRANVIKVVADIIAEREILQCKLNDFSFVRLVFPSDANFLLVRMTNADAVYHYLIEQGIIVRNRSNVELCADCLRITIGTAEENKKLINAFERYQ